MLSKVEVEGLVLSSVEGRTLGIFGEPRVNVVKLNHSLMRLSYRRAMKRGALNEPKR